MKWYNFLTSACIVLNCLQICHSHPGGLPSGNRGRSNSFTNFNLPITINSNGRNIVVPKVPVSDLGENRVPFYRAEATPNQRLDITGALPKPDGQPNNAALFVAIASDSKRTEAFMQQARSSPEGLKEATNLQNNLRKTLFPIDYAERVKAGQFDYRKNIQTAVNDLKFDANGQTIRSGTISNNLARKILSQSVPENLSKVGLDGGKKRPDVINVDITKAANQVGVRGNTLKELKKELAQSPVREGTTFGGRRRSMPNLASSGWNTTPPPKVKTASNAGQTGGKNGNTVPQFDRQAMAQAVKNMHIPPFKPKLTGTKPSGIGTSNVAKMAGPSSGAKETTWAQIASTSMKAKPSKPNVANLLTSQTKTKPIQSSTPKVIRSSSKTKPSYQSNVEKTTGTNTASQRAPASSSSMGTSKGGATSFGGGGMGSTSGKGKGKN